MNHQAIRELADSLREHVKTLPGNRTDLAWALISIAGEQPCDSEGNFGNIDNLKHYKCARLFHYHRDSQCAYMTAENRNHGCQRLENGRYCCAPLVDGKCPIHDCEEANGV